MSSRARRALWLAGLSILGALVTSLQAQTWVAGTGNWSNDAMWSAPPTPASDTALMFPMLGSGTLAYTSTNDLPGAFTLVDLLVTGVPSGSLVIGSGPTASLRFANVNPVVAVGGAGGDLLINSRVVNTNGPLTLAAAPGGFIRFAGPVRSAASVSLVGTAAGRAIFDTPNSLSGGFSGSRSGVNNASVVLGTVDSLGTGAITADGLRLSLGSATFAAPPGAPPFLRNAISLASGGLILGDGRSFTLTGPISGGGTLEVQPTSLSVGTWTIAGANTLTGQVNVRPAPGASGPVVNTLAFRGPASISPSMALNTFGTTAAVGFIGAAGSYTVNNGLTLNGGGAISVFDQGGRADITYAGAVSGTGGLVRSGAGVLTLSGSNTYAGGTTLAGGYTAISTDARLGAANTTLTFAGGGMLLQPGFGGSTRPINTAFAGGTLAVSDTVTWSGAITNVGATPGGLTKAGTGTLVLTNTGNSVGSLAISSGTVVATGAGRIITTGSISLTQGAGLVLDNSTTNVARIGGNIPMQLWGSTLRLVGNGTQNSAAVSTGVLSLGNSSNAGQGINVISVEPGAGGHAAIRFGSTSRTANNGMQTLFTGLGLGDAPVSSLSAGKSNIIFTTAPALVSNIIPWAVMDRGAGKELAGYSASNGVVPATYDSATVNNGTLMTANVVVGSDATLVGGGTINAGKFTGGTIDLTAGTLNVVSGAMLFTGPTTIQGGTLTIGVSTLNSATAPTANLFVHADTTIASRLFTFINSAGLNSGLAKSGPGVLTLSNTTNNYNGATRVLEGTLRLGASGVIPNNSTVVLNPGATLDMNGFNDVVGALGEVNPLDDTASYQTATLLLGAGSLISGGEGNGTTYMNFNVVGTGTFIKQGTGTLNVSGTQAFTGTLTVANGTIALGTHFTAGTGFANAGRINIGQPGGAGTLSGEVGLRLEEGLRGFDRPIFVQAAVGRTATLAIADSVAATIISPISINNAQGLNIDAAGGATLAGTIAGANVPLRTFTTGIGESSSRGVSLRIAGNNTYTGTTTLAADTTVWANPNAFGLSTASPLLLGSPDGDDTPELSGDVGGLTLSRPITIQGSLNAAPNYAMISSRVPAGGGTIAYSGAVNISGSRSKLVLFSTNGEPLVVSGSIAGGQTAVNPNARVQVGFDFSADDVTTRSTVVLSGANSYVAGTTLAAGTLVIAGNTLLNGTTGSIVSSPLGTGSLTIGISSVAPGHEPTLVAAGAPRTLKNTVNVTRNFAVSGTQPLTLNGSLLLGDVSRVVSIDPATALTIGGAIGGTANSALIKEGAGVLVLSGGGAYSGSLVANEGLTLFTVPHVFGGSLHVGPLATAQLLSPGATVVSASAVTVDTTNSGRLDLTDRSFIVDYSGASPLADVTALIASGHAGGTWNGPGIASSIAASGLHAGIGVIEASDIGANAFAGQGFVGDAVLLSYTLYGDTDLNRVVDIDDFSRMATTFNQPGRWFNGDFNFNGLVDIDDFERLAANFNQTIPASAGRSAIPEPSGLALGLFSATLLRRRRNDGRYDQTGIRACKWSYL